MVEEAVATALDNALHVSSDGSETSSGYSGAGTGTGALYMMDETTREGYEAEHRPGSCSRAVGQGSSSNRTQAAGMGGLNDAAGNSWGMTGAASPRAASHPQPSDTAISDHGGGGMGKAKAKGHTIKRYHEVICSSFWDPLLGRRVLMLLQTDVTLRILAERRIAALLEAEHELLENIFPRHVLEKIALSRALGGTNKQAAARSSPTPGTSGGNAKQQPGRKAFGGLQAALPALLDARSVATAHEQVTIMFADIVGFTPLCEQVEPWVVMDFLNDLFSRCACKMKSSRHLPIGAGLWPPACRL